MAKTVYLYTPIEEEEIRALKLDDVVYLTGETYTMLYADHYTVVMDLIKEGKPLPMELKNGVIYNTGTIYRKNPDGSYDLRALGATTSSKFNEYTPEFIRLTGVRAIIGKGGMDRAVLEAMKECGCVYLAIAGGCSAVYTPKSEICGDYWPELMPVDNQRLKLKLDQFGPLIVAMDADGNSLYDLCAAGAGERLPDIYRKIGISEGEK